MNLSKKIKKDNKPASEVKENTSGAAVKVPAKKVKRGPVFGGRDIKPIVLTVLCVAVVLVLCIGVGIQQFKPKVVVTVGDTKITMDDMMYPIYEVESQYLPYNEMYESVTGSSVWEAEYQGSSTSGLSGVTNSIGLKQEVINSEVQYEIMYQKAVKAKYKLTNAQKKDAKKRAKEALKGLSWLQKLQLNISESKLTDRFEKRLLSESYQNDNKEKINKTVDEKKAIKNISKKDYRQYNVQFYYGATSTTDSKGKTKKLSASEKKSLKAKIETIAKKAANGEKFTKLISSKEKSVKFEKSGKIIENQGWNYVSAANLKKIKKMKNGQLSKAIIDDKTGYYVVVKMINNNSTEAYKSACDSAIDSARSEAYQKWYEKEQKGIKTKVNTDVWSDVTIGSVTTDIVTAEDLQKMKEDSSDASSSK